MTIKEYYNDEFLSSCTAKVTAKNEFGIVLNRTVAYAEGGGQEGDIGVLILSNGEEIPFVNTTKFGGRAINLDDFSGIFVDTDVLHHIDEQNLSKFQIGDEILVKIDIKRRAKLTMNHTGIHIALMALDKLRNGIQNQIYGCKITENDARLDFRVDEKFSSEELEKITQISNDMIKSALNIKTYSSDSEKEALYWECDGYKMACGGTHFKNTKFLGKIIAKRKNLGKGVDRLKIEFEEFDLPLHLYHN